MIYLILLCRSYFLEKDRRIRVRFINTDLRFDFDYVLTFPFMKLQPARNRKKRRPDAQIPQQQAHSRSSKQQMSSKGADRQARQGSQYKAKWRHRAIILLAQRPPMTRALQARRRKDDQMEKIPPGFPARFASNRSSPRGWQSSKNDKGPVCVHSGLLQTFLRTRHKHFFPPAWTA